jgi:hypothetical protein
VHMDDEVGITLALTRPVVEINCHARLAPGFTHRVPPVRPSHISPYIDVRGH